MGICISKKSSLLDQDILSADYNNSVPFAVQIQSGKVIKVYDGDTITVASKLPHSQYPVYRFSIRLRGIDSPEIKSRNELEKSAAVIARDALHAKIFDKIVTFKNVGTEKYGRMLADVYLEDENINQWVLDNKYAVAYNGGKKTTWKFDG